MFEMERNGERGRVFDFRGAENGEVPDISESSTRRKNRQYPAVEMGSEHNNQQKEGTDAIGFITEHVTERSVKLKVSMQKTADEVIGCQGMEEKNAMALEREGFVMGSHTSMSGERDNRSRNSRQSNSSWVLRNQNKRRAIGVVRERSTKDNEEGPLKRKATEDGEVTSKVSKHYEDLMVYQKPPNP